MEFEPAIIDIFIAESKDLLHKVEHALLQIEQGDHSIELIHSIFRIFHNLKGSSAMFEFKDLTRFLHELESALIAYKTNNMELPANKVTILLQAVDCLNAVLDEGISKQISSTTSANINNIIAKLKADSAEIVSTNKVVEAESKVLPCNMQGQPNIENVTLSNVNPNIEDKSINKDIANKDFLVNPTLQSQTIDLGSPSINPNILVDKSVAVSLDNYGLNSTMVVGSQFSNQNLLAHKSSDVIKNDLIKNAQATPDLSTKILNNPKTLPAEDKTFIKVDPKKLDEIINLIGELVIMQSHLNTTVKLLPANIENIVDNTEKISNLIELLGGLSLQLRMVPVKTILDKFNRMVRDLAIKANKQIKLEITGDDTELDKSILEKLNDPLVHLLRNACDHGIDSPEQRLKLGKPTIGSVIIRVAQQNNEALITVTDDGRGIDLIKIKNKAITLGLISADANLTDQELINFIFRSGFSTAGQVTEISGRGVGMDIVKKEVEKLHGSITINSKIKQGTTMALKLPLTLAIIKGLLIKIDNFLAIIPVWNVVECVQINSEQYQQILTKRHMNFRNTLLPGLILSNLLGIGNPEPSNIVVIVNYADYQVGVVVDCLLGEVQAVIKNTPEILSDIAWFNGATILGNGQVAVILDIPRMIAALDKSNLNNCKATA